MMKGQNLLDELREVLSQDERFVIDGDLAKNKIVEYALKLDGDLLELLLENERLKDHFFEEVNGTYVFDKHEFQRFVSNKQFLPDSYTAFKNKIGLTSEDEYIADSKDVVLRWPYKDCVLEGGQTKEDAKRDEIFWNETLAPDQIDRLLDPKVLTSFKKFDQTDKSEVKSFSLDNNYLIKGNNLLALSSLKKTHSGKINLIYIDPPFNTGNDSFKYNDRFNHSTWLTFMKNRLEIARELLSRDGNIFIHMDINESHYLKSLADEIFGRDNFVEEIIWSYGSPSGGRAAGPKPVIIHNYILHYAKEYSDRKQNKIYTPYSDEYIENWFKYEDEDGRKYQRRQRGKDEEGNTIWERQYLDESKGVPLTSVWDDIKQVYADPRAYKEDQQEYTELIRDFSGQKPEELLKRIIDMATDENDIVLDFFSGSGTTGAVAHKMNRRYIMVEQMEEQIEVQKDRLKKVIEGDQTGISDDVNWEGGGNFIYCELMGFNQRIIKRIEVSSHEKELLEIWEDMKEQAFLSYQIDVNAFDESVEEFKDLSLEDQKKFLIEILDKNQLCVNYSEIENEDFNISEEEKELNRKIYNLGD